MKTKSISKYITGLMFVLGTLRFDERSFFNTLIGFTPYSDYKSINVNHAVFPGVFISDKVLKLNTINKIH